MNPNEHVMKGLCDELQKTAGPAMAKLAGRVSAVAKLVRKAAPAAAAAGVGGTAVATGVAVKQRRKAKDEEAKKNAVIRYMIMQRLSEQGPQQ